jgi:hypothetical protein
MTARPNLEEQTPDGVATNSVVKYHVLNQVANTYGLDSQQKAAIFGVPVRTQSRHKKDDVGYGRHGLQKSGSSFEKLAQMYIQSDYQIRQGFDNPLMRQKIVLHKLINALKTLGCNWIPLNQIRPSQHNLTAPMLS